MAKETTKRITLTDKELAEEIRNNRPYLISVLMCYEWNTTPAFVATMNEVVGHWRRAIDKHPNFYHSPHEGYGIITEEWKEFQDAVFADKRTLAREEIYDLAVTCLRYLTEVPILPPEPDVLKNIDLVPRAGFTKGIIPHVSRNEPTTPERREE